MSSRGICSRDIFAWHLPAISSSPSPACYPYSITTLFALPCLALPYLALLSRATLSRPTVMQFKFRLDPSVTSPAIPENPVNFCPDSSFNSFRVAPAPPSVSYGSFEYDSRQPKYNLRWNTWEEFSKWLEHEEISKAIELRRVGEKTGKDKYALGAEKH
ncbi:hypothetical protein BT96DRAFT_557034 [Gymnopus androsaceus JB14]|uniref:Uncharacterized protein n=1 Tax=Gymnopus androsaceus JB14 TaxID=1447944 RepID=A0A6A4HYI9_9AGAR|nr:hypothetical protein BT96DRAFT_557034 [Gymnopus androsaceus JB14]